MDDNFKSEAESISGWAIFILPLKKVGFPNTIYSWCTLYFPTKYLMPWNQTRSTTPYRPRNEQSTCAGALLQPSQNLVFHLSAEYRASSHRSPEYNKSDCGLHIYMESNIANRARSKCPIPYWAPKHAAVRRPTNILCHAWLNRTWTYQSCGYF